MIAVSVIIPNYNGASLLPGCLSALGAQTFKDFEVVLVDNGSTDASIEIARVAYPGLELVSLDKNLGFAKACNEGLKVCRGDWIAVLNTDAGPKPGWLAALLAAGNSADDIGMVASRVLRGSAPDTIDSLGLIAGRNGLIYLRGLGLADAPDDELAETEEVFGPSGVAALYRRSMIESIGFFEGSFFAYYEDADLGFRARWSGWRCLLANRARVVHKHSATADAMGLGKTLYLHKNRVRTLWRNWPIRSMLTNAHRLVGYDVLSTLYAMISERSLDTFRAGLGAAGFFVSDVGWRRQQAGLRSVEPTEIDRWLTWEHPGAIETFRRKRNT